MLHAVVALAFLVSVHFRCTSSVVCATSNVLIETSLRVCTLRFNSGAMMLNRVRNEIGIHDRRDRHRRCWGISATLLAGKAVGGSVPLKYDWTASSVLLFHV